MRKVHIYMLIYIFVMAILILYPLMVEADGRVCLNYQGFAVDQDNYLYLGKGSVIAVYDLEGNELREISIPPLRGYNFTITEDNEILIFNGSCFYAMSLYGENVREYLGTDETINDGVSISTTKFVSSDGTVYVRGEQFFRTSIYKLDDGCKTKIFQMPSYDYSLRLMNLGGGFSMVVAIPFFVYRHLVECGLIVPKQSVTSASDSAQKKGKIRTLHNRVCIVTWSIWLIGITLTAIVNLFQLHSKDWLFNTAFLYSSIVLLCSLLPFEPVLFAATVIYELKLKNPFRSFISQFFLFFIIAAIWLIYIRLYIVLIENK